MQIKSKTNCPLNSFEPCRELECAWFLRITGSNPNSGETVDDWGCSMSWLPILLIENAKQQRQTGAAVESFRNEMVTANETSKKLFFSSQLLENKNF